MRPPGGLLTSPVSADTALVTSANGPDDARAFWERRARRVTRRVAVAWSSALFGLWHVLPSGGLAGYNPVVADLLDGPAGRLAVTAAAVAATALAGVVLCWLRLRAGSLLAPVMLHVATNSLAYAAAWTVLS